MDLHRYDNTRLESRYTWKPWYDREGLPELGKKAASRVRRRFAMGPKEKDRGQAVPATTTDTQHSHCHPAAQLRSVRLRLMA